MQRLRVYDLRLDGRLGNAVGICQSDVKGYCSFINAAQRRLLLCKEAGEESWWGSWAEIQFTVTRAVPFFTLPREVARLELVDICNCPVAVQNQFYEYLRFGNGHLPKLFRQQRCGCFQPQVLSRNNVPTFTDLTGPPQYIRIYPTDPADSGKVVIMQGTDNNDNVIYTQNGLNRITGVSVSIQMPFVTVVLQGSTVPIPFNSITGIQKDATVAPVRFTQVDPTTGNELLLHTMEPSETTAWYRRYYFDNLPINCCFDPNTGVTNVLVTAIAKLELIPVVSDTDYTLIQNMEALIEEAQAVRYSTIDSQQSKQNEAIKHRDAVRLLRGELSHYVGLTQPAVFFAPFGSARLERQKIGTLI
jgi:hypothetical protein